MLNKSYTYTVPTKIHPFWVDRFPMLERQQDNVDTYAARYARAAVERHLPPHAAQATRIEIAPDQIFRPLKGRPDLKHEDYAAINLAGGDEYSEYTYRLAYETPGLDAMEQVLRRNNVLPQGQHSDAAHRVSIHAASLPAGIAESVQLAIGEDGLNEVYNTYETYLIRGIQCLFPVAFVDFVGFHADLGAGTIHLQAYHDAGRMVDPGAPYEVKIGKGYVPLVTTVRMVRDGNEVARGAAACAVEKHAPAVYRSSSGGEVTESLIPRGDVWAMLTEGIIHPADL